MYYERTLGTVIKQTTETFPVVIVTGPRQVGKQHFLTKFGGTRSESGVFKTIQRYVSLLKASPELLFNVTHHRFD